MRWEDQKPSSTGKEAKPARHGSSDADRFPHPGTGWRSQDSPARPCPRPSPRDLRRPARVSANANEDDLLSPGPTYEPCNSEYRESENQTCGHPHQRSRNLITPPLFHCRCNQPLLITAGNSRALWSAIKWRVSLCNVSKGLI